MAATRSKRRRSAALHALTAAALALPGVTAAHADDGDQFTFEYHHYEEGDRDLISQNYRDLKLKGLQADSLSLGMRGSVSDRVKFGLNYSQDTWSGATPVTTVPYAAITDQLFSGASAPNTYYTDPQHHPVVVNWDTFDGSSVAYKKDSRLVHVMASASPETRRQLAGNIGYEGDRGGVNLGLGASYEPDYHSFFASLGGRLDFNGKLTTLSWSGSYTATDISASLEANSAADWGKYLDNIRPDSYGISTLYENRHDASASVGLTQIIDHDSLVSATLEYTRSTGYLSNPYKATVFAFDDPDQFIDSTGLRQVILKGVLEQRPTLRNQWALSTRYVQYVEGSDAALHLNYRFYHDDWGINAHTLEASFYQPLGDGWMIVPDARYYTQTRANFYQPYFQFNQAFPILFPRNPELPPNLDFSQIAIQHYSSDERLSGFGTVTGQLAISKQLRDDMRVEVGAEYSVHAGSLKLGGGGEQSFADFQSYTVFASLSLDLAGRSGDADPRASAAAPPGGSDGGPNLNIVTPAGVAFTRLLDNVGDFAMGFHHDYAIREGHMLNGSHTVTDDVIAALDCGGQPCTRTSTGEFSHITALDLLYKPFEGVTLMVTPRFVDLHMDQRDVGGFFFPEFCCIGPGGGGAAPSYHHTTGGLGDTGVYALARLWSDGGQQLQAGVGLEVPTGSANKRVNISRDYLSYGLQTGSGTWDLHPSITYLGEVDRFSWGAQVSGIKRLNSNGSGYRLGDMGQATAWGSYQIMDWLFASVRGVVTVQGSIAGQFKDHVTPTQTGYTVVDGVPQPVYQYDSAPQTELAPSDLPGSSGGSFGDVGFGLTAVLPDGAFAGDRIAVEWLQPVHDHVNGYQLTRAGTLSLNWDFTL